MYSFSETKYYETDIVAFGVKPTFRVMSPTTSISWLYRQLHYSIFRTILQAFFDHMFDHSWVPTVWKQCSREHTKALLSD